jgi:hypothetical protein
MTPPPSFPRLSGQGWSVHKRPVFATLVAEHVSGREVRDPQWRYPLWEFELTFDGLASDAVSYPGLGDGSLQSLMGLFLQCRGQLGVFLYADPTDGVVASQLLATGDGTSTGFTFIRTLGGYSEPVGYVVGAPTVLLNGVRQNSGWSFQAPNRLVFSTPPAAGSAIAANFSFAFQCRFLDDSLDFEQIMANLWTLQSLKFRSVRPS